MATKKPSPSRTYVAMCDTGNFDGYYFRQFVLPEVDPSSSAYLTNDVNTASWYFLNRVDFYSCVKEVFAAEDLLTLRVVGPYAERVANV